MTVKYPAPLLTSTATTATTAAHHQLAKITGAGETGERLGRRYRLHRKAETEAGRDTGRGH